MGDIPAEALLRIAARECECRDMAIAIAIDYLRELRRMASGQGPVPAYKVDELATNALRVLEPHESPGARRAGKPVGEGR